MLTAKSRLAAGAAVALVLGLGDAAAQDDPCAAFESDAAALEACRAAEGDAGSEEAS
jgi:hypothetical protein